MFVNPAWGLGQMHPRETYRLDEKQTEIYHRYEAVCQT